ncbi:hypothetical protein B0H13DRAFT_1868454 [Mycena leptocephala]|nr:hypothetical protein B0H13DRAFT_1886912 [Mycena leptocephala]KAJ7919531.1 hypothetical protein B0H13DRAFT_1868454 [Mycena leptocephala]
MIPLPVPSSHARRLYKSMSFSAGRVSGRHSGQGGDGIGMGMKRRALVAAVWETYMRTPPAITSTASTRTRGRFRGIRARAGSRVAHIGGKRGNGGREEKTDDAPCGCTSGKSALEWARDEGRASAGKEEGPRENQERGEWRKIPPLTAMRRAHLALPPNAQRIPHAPGCAIFAYNIGTHRHLHAHRKGGREEEERWKSRL